MNKEREIETQKHNNQEKEEEKMKKAVRKLFTTRYLLEDVGLMELVKKAWTDTKRKEIEKQVAEVFHYLLTKEGVVTINESKMLKFKASHICQEDLDKIWDYILNYKGIE